MTWTVFLIAGIPAGVVAWVGYTKTSRGMLYATFLFAVGLGAVTGNPAYFAADLILALVGLYVGHIEQGRLIKRKKSKEEQRPPQPPIPTVSVNWKPTVWWLLAIAGFFTYKFLSISKPPVIHQTPPPATYVPSTSQSQTTKYEKAPAYIQAPIPSLQPRPRTIKQCLLLQSDDAMSRCMEKVP